MHHLKGLSFSTMPSCCRGSVLQSRRLLSMATENVQCVGLCSQYFKINLDEISGFCIAMLNCQWALHSP